MTPAHPPPPTNSNLPFQFSGSQTSMSISESDEGLSVAATLQNAGTVSPAFCPPRWPPRPPPALAPGGVNVPAGTGSAIVMVVFGRETDLRLAQGVVASAAENSTTAILAIICTSRMGGNYHSS